MGYIDFPEEYSVYIELCRSLKLKRYPLPEAQEGDWFWSNAYCRVLVAIPQSEQRPKDSDFWLPQISDWLDILAIAGIESVHFHRVGDDYIVRGEWDLSYHSAKGSEVGRGMTREEAIARLAIAVGAVK